MNNLRNLHDTLRDFAERHEMINESILVKSEEELGSYEFNYRSMIVMPLEANISRENNSPTYYIDFGVVLLDKVPAENDEAYINSVDENIFIMGQLQDYLGQTDFDVEFGNVDLNLERMSDHNITSAIADFTFTLPRNPGNRAINF